MRDHRRSSVVPGSLFTDLANILPSVAESKMSLHSVSTSSPSPESRPPTEGAGDASTRNIYPQPLAYLAADGSLGEQPLQSNRHLSSSPPSDFAPMSSARESGIVLIGPGAKSPSVVDLCIWRCLVSLEQGKARDLLNDLAFGQPR